MQRVVITDYLAPPPVIEEKELARIASVHCLQAKSTRDLSGKLGGVDGIILCHEVSIPASIVSELNHCIAIVRCGVGYDNVDIEAAGARGIYVCNVPDYGVDEVADHAIGLMLACNRGFVRVERVLRKSLVPWDMRAVRPVPRLAGATLGIIGLGRIGSATALRAKAMRMKVIAFDPYVRPGTDKVLDVPLVSWDEVLSTSDVISLHTPLTRETRHLIDRKALGKMKASVLLINTARGQVVDIDALTLAVKERRIAGAGVDVLPEEPARASMSLVRLWQEDMEGVHNLIVTPHIAFYSEEGLVEMRAKAARELARVLSGGTPKNCVNSQFLPAGSGCPVSGSTGRRERNPGTS